jgi:hypothetical protein
MKWKIKELSQMGAREWLGWWEFSLNYATTTTTTATTTTKTVKRSRTLKNKFRRFFSISLSLLFVWWEWSHCCLIKSRVWWVNISVRLSFYIPHCMHCMHFSSFSKRLLWFDQTKIVSLKRHHYAVITLLNFRCKRPKIYRGGILMCSWF